jgi:REP element-mobilizing transposase RayT
LKPSQKAFVLELILSAVGASALGQDDAEQKPGGQQTCHLHLRTIATPRLPIHCVATVMSHPFSANYVHLVFSTDGRLPSIPEDRLQRLYDFIGGICRKLQVQLLASGGTRDHVHLLLAVPTKLSVSEVAGKIKANFSRWMSRRFAWQQGTEFLA